MKRLKTQNEITRVDPKVTSNPDLVCFSHLRWEDVYQRPHHLMSRWGKERRVFYMEEFEIDEGPRRLEVRQVEPGVKVVVPYLKSWEQEEKDHLPQMFADFFAEHAIQKYILWYYTPMAVRFTRKMSPLLTVYDCMDELSYFKGAPDILPKLEADLFKQANVVFTGGYSLYEVKKHLHSNIHPFPSSIDANHFKHARLNQPEPEDQAVIPHPRLGYFGVLDERVDWTLIADLAKARPNWHLVLVGPVAKVDPKDLPKQENIHYLGQKDYSELPAYLAGWDVAMIPFALTDATRFISPTKTPEYLAGGIPVVSTSIKDIEQQYGGTGLVAIVDDFSDFLSCSEAAIHKPAEERRVWLKKIDALLDGNSWDKTWAQMKNLVEESLISKSGQKRLPGRDITLPISKPKKGKSSGSGGNSGYSGSNGDDHRFLASQNMPGAGRRTERPFDFLIVGAGFAGSVLAERLARGSGYKVLLIDRRNHIGGNAYDHYDDAGLLVHKYGPHIFHTNSTEVFSYLSHFTEWRPYEHRVRASVDGQLVPIPINLDTVNRLYGLNLTSFELDDWFKSMAEPVKNVKTSEDVVVSRVGRTLYEKFFRNYTRKQWGLDPSELDAQVTSRVPVRLNRDDRYFGDVFQSMPLRGYTRLFENLIDHPNIKVMINTDYEEVAGLIPHRQVIYTGPVDEYFDYRYGRLPYRSLEFKFQTLNEEQHQPVAVVNFPNEHLYTRVTEFKHLTGQDHPKTSLVYEYPCAEGDPYYPIPRPENAELYKKYRALAEATPGVYFAGRLGTYRYYNMDQVTAQALTLYGKITGVKSAEITKRITQATYQIDVPCPILVTQVLD